MTSLHPLSNLLELTVHFFLQRVDIFWRQSQREHIIQDRNEDPLVHEMKSKNKVSTFKCSILDGHPLVLRDRITTEDILNESQSFISFELEKMQNHNAVTSNNNVGHKDKEEVHHEKKITLKDCIENIHSVSNESGIDINHCDSDLFVWGNVIQVSEIFNKISNQQTFHLRKK